MWGFFMMLIYGDRGSAHYGPVIWGRKIVGTTCVDTYIPKARRKSEKCVTGSSQRLTRCSQPNVSFLHENQFNAAISLISILTDFN